VNWQLAQFNVLRAKYDHDDPRMAEFFAALSMINELGDAAPGAVWRCRDEEPSGSHPGFTEPRVLRNLTVWRDIESVWNFAYTTSHADFLRRRSEWFEIDVRPTTALWWIPASHRPTLDDAIARLEHLRAHGSTPHAFSFRDAHEPPRD